MMTLSALMYWKAKMPIIKGRIFKLLFACEKLKIGNNFKCERFPELLLTQNGRVEIGDNVELKRNVEIRSHNDAIIEIGNNCRIDRGVRILGANNAKIKIGEGARIGLYSVLNGGDSITIGKKCLISGFVYLQSSMHRFQNELSIQQQGYNHAPIRLEDDIWLGAHVVILPGVLLERGAIVGSNAVVNKNVASNTIVGGVPAKIIKSRF